MRIPLADGRSFAGALLRGRVLRLGLAAAIAALAAAALALAFGLREERATFLPSDAGGVVVLDVSTSIGSDTHRQIHAVLGQAARSRDRFGFVVYSDTAYEALPPGTPARELEPFRRFFGEDAPTGRFGQGITPWVRAFTSGTKISTGLRLAREILRRDAIGDGSVVLVSDLEDDQNDVGALTETLIRFRREGIPLRVVALSPAPADRRLFEELLPPGSVAEAARPGSGPDSLAAAARDAAVPAGLVAAVLLLLAALAANELLNGRLAWAAAREASVRRAT
ncbi:MAG TPA: vWA domain-containing protein [Gaiellaceae bacterium]|nr:vWA domain-containing protein [Gaiellaceae bacterium]